MSRQIHRITRTPVPLNQQREFDDGNDRKKFNYPIEISALHRDGRCLKTNKIWVQGLPMDITQVIGIIDILKREYRFDVTDESKENLCARISNDSIECIKRKSIKSH
jgi:hypothetical protein